MKSPFEKSPRGQRKALSPRGFILLLTVVLLAGTLLIVPASHPRTVRASSGSPTLDSGLSLEAKIRELSNNSHEGLKSYEPIVISDSEANAYLKSHGPEFLPPGVHDPNIRITPERVFGGADVDFDELSRAYSNSSDWGPKVLAAMFKGKQHVGAAGKVESRNGQAKVKIETVTIGTTTVPDWLVDFVLENYLQPRYKMDLTKPFELPDHVTNIQLRTGKAVFYRSPDKKH